MSSSWSHSASRTRSKYFQRWTLEASGGNPIRGCCQWCFPPSGTWDVGQSESTQTDPTEPWKRPPRRHRKSSRREESLLLINRDRHNRLINYFVISLSLIEAFSLAIQSNYDWSFNAVHVRCRGIEGIGLMLLAVAYCRIRRKIDSFEALLCLHSRVCIETPKRRCVWGEEDGTENRWADLHFFSICSSFFNVLDVIKQVTTRSALIEVTYAMKICPETFAKWKPFLLKKSGRMKKSWSEVELRLNCL